MEENKEIVKKVESTENSIDKTTTAVEAKPEEKKGRSMFFWYGMLFLGYTFLTGIVSLFHVFDPVNNVLEQGTKLELSFYLGSSQYSSSNIQELTPISTQYYSYSSSGNNVNFNITHKLTKENIIKKDLFLYATAKFNHEIDARGFFKVKENEPLFFSKINLLKYSKKIRGKRNDLLLDDMPIIDNEEDKKIKNSTEKFLYYKPEITCYIIDARAKEESTTFAELNYLKIDFKLNPTRKVFLPPIALSEFWIMSNELKQIATDKEIKESPIEEELKINIDIREISLFKFKYLKAIEFNDNNMSDQFGLESSKDIIVELIKYNSQNYLLLLVTVQTLHLVFSFLGFANDISHHKKINKLDGLYTKIYFIRLFHYGVAVIYYYMEDVNKIIYFELVISLIIELWKFRKIFKTEVSLAFPFISFKNRIQYEKSTSTSYEEDAIKLTVKVIFIPLAVSYLVYRVYYYPNYIQTHIFKFIIEYFFFLLNIFGFALMTPQIYINYKMKSVEHMPIKALAYKFLNTIIDDIFAFALDTPTLHRISVFKDDIIFVIFIVQMILYRKNKRIEVLQETEVKKDEIKEKTE